MQSDQRDQADDQRVEGLMLVADRHAVLFLEFTYRGTAQVFGNAVRGPVDEPQIQCSVAILDETLAERAFIGDERTGQPHHIVKRLRDVAGLAMLVPLFQMGDDFTDDIVEHGIRNLVFVLEIVVEKRSGHADPFGDIADRDLRKPFFQADLTCRLHDLQATRVSNGAGGRFRFPGHGSLLPIAWQRLVRHGGDARVLGAQQSAFVTDGTPITRFMSDFQSTGCAGCRSDRHAMDLRRWSASALPDWRTCRNSSIL